MVANPLHGNSLFSRNAKKYLLQIRAYSLLWRDIIFVKLYLFSHKLSHLRICIFQIPANMQRASNTVINFQYFKLFLSYWPRIWKIMIYFWPLLQNHSLHLHPSYLTEMFEFLRTILIQLVCHLVQIYFNFWEKKKKKKGWHAWKLGIRGTLPS